MIVVSKKNCITLQHIDQNKGTDGFPPVVFEVITERLIEFRVLQDFLNGTFHSPEGRPIFLL
jgi:hypothetical protein